MKPNDFKILVVDDEVDLADIMKDFLCLEGFDVLIANDGAQALDIVNKTKVHAIISDIRMPKMDGVELLKSVKKIHPDIHFILVSGYSDYSEDQVLKLGAEQLFAKPVEFERVNQAVKKVLKV